MANERALTFSIRTPRETVLECAAASVRLPTHTGQVGLRPRCEPCALAVEPGLVLIRTADSTHYAGTAGGVLRTDGIMAVLLTPLAVTGDNLDDLEPRLEAALVEPSAEFEVRRTITRLETNIVQELRRGDEPRGPLRGGRP